jgi:hypothetical protein
MKLDLAYQRKLLVVWFLVFTLLVALCIHLATCFWPISIEPLGVKSVFAELHLTRAGMDLHTTQLI